ncbi:hypothetical protein HN748_04070 [Candidatus Peregrinibacteria bacterium]|nr:hypothetical protein [Candidatus Peregrinibacteria bacterium]MBT7484474.1 hypothetical protein [Candidatus Peregrinibacteria bacterium]MBT7703386.1 hypothetical protein [Candidatus Peregrinibacteria bacterium]
MSEHLEASETPDSCTGNPIEFGDVNTTQFNDPERKEALGAQISLAEADDMFNEFFGGNDLNFKGEDISAWVRFRTAVLNQVSKKGLTREEFQEFLDDVEQLADDNTFADRDINYANLGDVEDLLEKGVSLLLYKKPDHFETYLNTKPVIELIPKIAQEIVDRRS